MVKPVLEYPITGYFLGRGGMKTRSIKLLALFAALLVGCATTDLKNLMDDYVVQTKDLADKGDPAAELRLGKAHYFGYMPLKAPNGITHYYPIEKNDALAYKNLSKAANGGNAEAAAIAGILAMNGDGTTQDDARAMDLFKMSAPYNNESRFFLSRYYWRSKDPEIRKKGFELVRDAAQTDSPELVFALANYYDAGIGVKRNKPEADKLKALGAKLAKERDELLKNRMAAFQDNAQRKSNYGVASDADLATLRGLQIFVTVIGAAATVAMLSNAAQMSNASGRGGSSWNGSTLDLMNQTRTQGAGTMYLYNSSGVLRGSVPVFIY